MHYHYHLPLGFLRNSNWNKRRKKWYSRQIFIREISNGVVGATLWRRCDGSRFRSQWHVENFNPFFVICAWTGTSIEHDTLVSVRLNQQRAFNFSWFMLIFAFEHFIKFRGASRVRHFTPNIWSTMKIELLIHYHRCSDFGFRLRPLFCIELETPKGHRPFSLCRWPDTYFRRYSQFIRIPRSNIAHELGRMRKNQQDKPFSNTLPFGSSVDALSLESMKCGNNRETSQIQFGFSFAKRERCSQFARPKTI